MNELSGKVALVTGGARGQGRAHALALAQAGADVAVCDIATDIGTVRYALGTPDELAETAAGVEKLDRRALSFVADVRDADAMQRVVEETIQELDRIDILVANAGIFSRGPLTELTPQAWQDMIDVNLTGVFNAIRAVVPTMVAQGSGRIVATASMAAKMGAPMMAHYAAAKWGVIGLVKSAALELAKSGVTVNAICPTNVRTPMMTNDDMLALFRPDLAKPTLDQSMLDAFAGTIPVGIPWVEPEDISGAMLFLVSDAARYITGETVSVSGGQSAMNVG
ncbi:mycofactocin-coupled SDR family oxidoreductase [Pseudonocardia oroxyli]|uniref:SDR family mycofactocin-dependent oxidoreductase n=1 Tax=Pseudonocardia oroxyli TaxID=366584 RepID=A0A1G7TMR2_PSEOR|nr:mycofactocin-coupled SDR family oxidoreductase [Pseudonocardia oroxyli]SDG35770.1 SDR family mycofactocin-dependent oxidoreductase [Pseudonocardia oroxyli]